MRTEISYVPRSRWRGRVNYVRDASGEHAADGLAVVCKVVGVNGPEALLEVPGRLLQQPRGKGRKRKFVACEISIHPVDAVGAKAAFGSLEEMERVAEEMLKEFHGCYALVGFHGLRDLHILMLNWGPTGLALKSYLPNRSNPRRVMVAVADRIEGELNATRAAQGIPLLSTMKEVRAKKRLRGTSLADMIAEQLPTDRDPTVQEILLAISGCGWAGVVRKRHISIQFSTDTPPRRYELDLFLRSVGKAVLRRRTRPRDREKPLELE